MGSWAKENHGTNPPTEVVRFGVQDVSAPGGMASKTTIELESTCKNPSEKPLVYENADKTIAGFTASNARLNYKINLIWIGPNNEILVDHNLNLRIAKMLERTKFRASFDTSGFYLANVVDHTLYIGYNTDSGKGGFTLSVDVAKAGELKIIPESIKGK
jgi:hypothetical protein